VPGRVTHLRVFVESATQDGRSVTANRRGVAELQIAPSDPLGEEPIVVRTQDVPGLKNSDTELDVGIAKVDGVIICSDSAAADWKRNLRKMGVRSISLRDNPNAIIYSHRIDVDFELEPGVRPTMLVFTDGTGATYVLRCLVNGVKTLTFNSSDPTIRRISACEIGMQGMKATAAAMTTVNSEELNAETEWFPGKNLLRAAKAVESVVVAVPTASGGAALAAGSIPIGGGDLTVRVRYWERNLRGDLPEVHRQVRLTGSRFRGHP
jgi:hypothetical protein